jgi:hypothetical protein
MRTIRSLAAQQPAQDRPVAFVAPGRRPGARRLRAEVERAATPVRGRPPPRGIRR